MRLCVCAGGGGGCYGVLVITVQTSRLDVKEEMWQSEICVLKEHIHMDVNLWG